MYLLHKLTRLYSKAHMDQAFEQAKVEVPATAKDWEPLRSYEKRLDALMTKEKGKFMYKL